jgi:hypothetical protein
MAGLNDFEDFISPLIAQQFPAVYREDGPLLVLFTKAYYEYLEQTDKELYVARKMFERNDVDQSVDTFLEHFRTQFLSGFPKDIDQGTPFTIKHIMDVYRSKGTPRAVELFLRLVYGIESTIYVPGQHIIAASDADFYEPKYIEVTLPYDQDEAFSNFQGKDITGTITGATATVDSCLKTSASGKQTYVMFLVNVVGTFKREELVGYVGGTLQPKIIGSLSNISLTANGSGLTIGDELAVTSSKYGSHGIVRVTDTTDGTGQATYTINQKGFGYSTNSAHSNVLVSTATMAVNTYTNSNATFRAEYGGNTFFSLETITQPVEYLDFTSATSTFVEALNTTSYVIGTNSSVTSLNSTNQLANGKIGVYSNSTASNGSLSLFVNSGTFGNQVQYFHQSNTVAFEPGETVSVNSTVTGVLNAANSTILTINAASIGFSNVTTQQVTGERSGAVSNGMNTAMVQTGVKKLFFAATLATNANSTAVANGYRTGTIIGANATAIGLVANSTDAFLTASQNFIKGSDSNTYANVFATRLGSGGSLTIGTLGAGTETKNVYTDFIHSSNNSANTSMLDVVINGSNSGVGIVNSVTITTAGSGYANSDALVFGANSTVFGGITSGKNPSLNAIATVGTDGSGVITSVTMTGQGNGYYHAPKVTITSSGGSSGVLTPVMHFGYGLAKHGNTINTTKSGGYSNVINDVLKFSEDTLGQINTFSSTSGGNNYTAPPFVLIQNRMVDKFNQRNVQLKYDTFVSGVRSNFLADDILVQTQPQSYLKITHNGANDAAFTVGEGIAQIVNSTVNNYATFVSGNTTVFTIRDGKRRKVESGGAINVGLIDASITWATGNTFVGLTSGSTGNVTGQSTSTVNRFVKGKVLTSNTSANILEVRMYDTRFDFNTGSNVQIEDYSSQANVSEVYAHSPSTSTRTTGIRLDERAGLNANLTVTATVATGLINTLDIVRSGYGYEDGETVTMSGGDLETISGAAVVNNHGIALGHHRNNKGFLNEDKYIHDNDFYQEFSYQVRTEIPFDKYKQQIKDVVHLAGSKPFGMVQTSATANMALAVANSSVSQA